MASVKGFVMFEYLVVFIVVGVAAFYVIRTLWKESEGQGCVGCNCAAKGEKSSELVQIKTIKRK